MFNCFPAAVVSDRDFTYGTTRVDGTLLSSPSPAYAYPPIKSYTPGITYQNNNSEIIGILMDLEKFGDGTVTSNGVSHIRNPQRISFLDLKQNAGTTSPGVGSDGVFRDPWGNPYIITLDLDLEDAAIDGLYGAIIERYDVQGGTAHKIKGSVLIWSFGPDGKADTSLTAPAPTTGKWQDAIRTGNNKDNIVSWSL